jgi:hypothetical protein
MGRRLKARRLARVRSLFPLGSVLLLGAVLLTSACESSPPEAAPPANVAEMPPPLGTFSAGRALADDVALAERRAGGGDGSNAELRSYVVEQLAPTGLAIETIGTPGVQGADSGVAQARSWSQTVATAPGDSSDLFVLVARLGEADPPQSGEQLREEVSGAALLLELARVLSTRTLPYTTRFVWIEGDRRASAGGDEGDASGSAALLASWTASGDLARIRLLVALGRVCRDDLRIARDLRSNRVHREDFYEAAVRTGRVPTFPRNQAYELVDASHLAFRSAGVRPIVALTAASGVPFEGHTCTAQSLDAVGAVALDALDAIGTRLAKIDRFARAPLATSGATAAPATATPPQQPAESVPYGPEPANP